MPWYLILWRLLLAAVFGGVIGWQRELADRPAGLRTHMTVAVGAALFMMISIADYHSRVADPTRIAAQVVTGIGFLGAGTIIRQGSIVRGLTTAASLWAVAAIGLASGLGYYLEAVLGTGLIFLTLTVFKAVELRLAGGVVRYLKVGYSAAEAGVEALETMLNQVPVQWEIREFQRSAAEIVVRLRLILPDEQTGDSVFKRLQRLPGLTVLKWE